MFAQLGCYVSLLEDIQCRYSLACNRLTSLLSQLEMPHASTAHTQYFLKKGRKNEEDAKIYQAYQDCTQLQLQFNLAHKAIDRLQKALGLKSGTATPSDKLPQMWVAALKQAPTDKLRVLAELLLDTLLSIKGVESHLASALIEVSTLYTRAPAHLSCESL